MVRAMPAPLPSSTFRVTWPRGSAASAPAWLSVFAYVLFGTYIGIGALAYDFGFSLVWVTACRRCWSGPGPRR